MCFVSLLWFPIFSFIVYITSLNIILRAALKFHLIIKILRFDISCLFLWECVRFFHFLCILHNFGLPLDIMNILLWKFRIFFFIAVKMLMLFIWRQLTRWDSKCKLSMSRIGGSSSGSSGCFKCATACVNSQRSTRALDRVIPRVWGSSSLPLYFLEIPSHPLAILVAPDFFPWCFWSEKQWLLIKIYNCPQTLP